MAMTAIYISGEPRNRCIPMIAAIFARESSGTLHDVLTTGRGTATEEP
jgi:hypothetical protein